jgi:hypothetical protein
VVDLVAVDVPVFVCAATGIAGTARAANNSRTLIILGLRAREAPREMPS